MENNSENVIKNVRENVRENVIENNFSNNSENNFSIYLENNLENDSENVREFEEYIDKKVVVLLTDNRFLYGTLKSYDQYNSISMNFVIERIFFNRKYAEKRLGLVAIRGENIAFIGIGQCELKELQKVDYETLFREIAEA